MKKALTSKSLIKEYTKKYNFYFKKDLGQNFLTDSNIVEKIVDSLEVSPEDVVLEVGPGIGSLTALIAETAKKVYAVEIDSYAVRMLDDVLSEYDNIEIINEDVLKCDFNDLLKAEIKQSSAIKFISNLPYYITSPVIMKALESGVNFQNMVVMLQKEVAKRLAAEVGSKDYGVFTIMVDYYAKVEYLFSVSKNVFIPAPKVDSAVIKIIPRENKKVDVKNEKLFFSVIRAGFQGRRKTILNSFSNGLNSAGITKEKIRNALDTLGIDKGLRAERLSIEEFADIANELSK